MTIGEAKYRALLEQNNDAIIILDLEGNHIEANQKALELLDYDSNELLKLSYTDLVDSTEIDERMKKHEALLRGNILPVFEGTMIKKDGNKIPVEVNAAVVRDADGKPIHIQTFMRNVAAQRKTVQELLKLSMVLEHNPASIVITDSEGVISYVNPKFSELTGYTMEDAMGRNPAILKSGLTPVEVYKDLWKTITSGKEWRGEFANKKKNGEIYWEDAIIAPILGREGEITNFVAVKQDITQRKTTLEALEESKERLALALEGGGFGLWDWNIQTGELIINERWAAIFEYTLDELEPSLEMWEKLVHPDDKQWVLEYLDEFINEKGPYEIEYRGLTKSGDVVWVLDKGKIVKWDDKRKPLRSTGTLQDITARKNAEQALLESQHRLREILESLPEGVGTTDLDEHLIFVNNAFAATLGYTVEELVGKSILDLIPPDDVEKVINETKRRIVGKASAYEISMVRKDGERRTVRVSAVPQRNLEGNIDRTLAVVVDITERLKAERDLRVSNRDLQLYASLLRHDIRNDLQIIIIQSEAAEMMLPSDSATNESFGVIRGTAERMASLLSILGDPDFISEEGLVDVIKSRATQAEIAHHDLKIAVKASEKAQAVKVSSERLLPAVLDNLFRNTAQYAGPKPKVDVIVEHIGNFIQIIVSDNGPGIPEEVRGTLFSIGASTTGGGLGLYLSKRIIEGYGGTIELLEHGPEGGGATYSIKLPLD
ncbi:MAG: PAS domain S-box protein [Candidatus Thorarchaeota archaeon]